MCNICYIFSIFSIFARKIVFMENPDLLFFCSICRNKTQEEIAQIKCIMTHVVKKYKKGDYIVYQGEKVSHLYMLTKGRVKTEIISNTGFMLDVEEIVAPFPLAAVFIFADNNIFPVNIIAIEDTEVALIKKESIEKQMAKCPYFLRGFIAFISNRIEFLSDRLKIYSLKNIKSKLSFYILQHSHNNEFNLNCSITSLAEYFGVERPSLSRAISEMVRDGIIEFKSGKGRILNIKEMKRII